jgi:Flp pilus assembly pilin Flp
MRRLLQRLVGESTGQDLAEYALLLALIVLAVAATISGFSKTLVETFGYKANQTDCYAKAPPDQARACEDVGKRDRQN